MRASHILPAFLLLGACSADGVQHDATMSSVDAVSFDGANYSDETGKIAHGERVADLLGCASCHAPDYSGVNFGEMIPLVEGLWATNISRTLPDFSEEQLEALLREGIHPEREIYLMPSRTSQFLSDADMGALIAYLRTIEPTGEATPPPPEGFEDAVAKRLPDEYWRVQEYGRAFYPNAEEEAQFYAKYRAPAVAGEHERGRYIAAATCTSCHGPGLDGYGEEFGAIDGVLDYNDKELRKLLVDSVNRDGETVAAWWGTGHEGSKLTQAELNDVEAYVRALARSRVLDQGD
ncbi:c-type cytochrome [Sphingomicrobium clamense]|uniref:Cytochrome c n=1 Tax=Sphingomicrobium clamense TaxID=2851013 RepID=A0ABS6V594_9SPHN|nr:c-type cytochrome [Sphingomicrobium sp. B8]MBW0144671.1 cytochrome c [Sphingomicrobium sp. B8]